MPQPDIEISVVVPVYNSEACLDALTQAVHATLRDVPYELILVNDRSADKSWDCICTLARGTASIVGINLRKNSGQDNAIMAGFRHVRGRYVVVMDDDLQHDPADIPRLWRACKEHTADACFAQFVEKRHAWWKNIGSWLNGKVAEVVIDKPKLIYLSPFKIIVRAVVDEIVRYDGPFPHVDGLLFAVTDNVVQIEAEHHVRYAGKSTYSLAKSIMVTVRLATTFSVMPLRFASYIGIATAILGFFMALGVIFQALFVHRPVEGWPSLMSAWLVFGGVMLTALGVIGEYVGRMYLRVNNRQQYSIKQIVEDGKA